MSDICIEIAEAIAAFERKLPSHLDARYVLVPLRRKPEIEEFLRVWQCGTLLEPETRPTVNSVPVHFWDADEIEVVA